MKNFLRMLTPEATRQRYETAIQKTNEAKARYNERYKAITGHDLPLHMKPKHGSYRLARVIVNWNKSTVHVHFHGHKIGMLNTKRMYIEKITLKRLPNMNDHDAVHAAFYVSPRRWQIPMFSPHARYRSATRAALPAHLAPTIQDPNISFSQ